MDKETASEKTDCRPFGIAAEQGPIRIALAHAMLEADDPMLLRPAISQIQTALDRDRSNSDGWRALGTAWAPRRSRPGNSHPR